MISTTAVSVLTRADSKFKSNESMKGKVLSDAYLEFIIVNKVCEQWNLNRGFRPFFVCVWISWCGRPDLNSGEVYTLHRKVLYGAEYIAWPS
jgi:hypothetical protein